MMSIGYALDRVLKKKLREKSFNTLLPWCREYLKKESYHSSDLLPCKTSVLWVMYAFVNIWLSCWPSLFFLSSSFNALVRSFSLSLPFFHHLVFSMVCFFDRTTERMDKGQNEHSEKEEKSSYEDEYITCLQTKTRRHHRKWVSLSLVLSSVHRIQIVDSFILSFVLSQIFSFLFSNQVSCVHIHLLT